MIVKVEPKIRSGMRIHHQNIDFVLQATFLWHRIKSPCLAVSSAGGLTGCFQFNFKKHFLDAIASFKMALSVSHSLTDTF